jgi:hypothetical protein
MTANETIYQAIYKTEKYTVVIVYVPLAGGGGAIEIVSVDLQPRPVSQFEERERTRTFKTK